jgi:cell wall-associated NlpC family hydrolase
MARRDYEGEVREQLFPLWLGEAEPTPTVEPKATPDPRVENIGKLGAMAFANVAIYDKPKETANVLGRESYHLLYIHSIHREFYRVTTQEGRTGYVKTTQVTPLSEAQLEAYLSAAMQLTYTAAAYAPDAFVTELETAETKGSMEERIYTALCRLGFDFEPFYYRVYQKDLQDEKKYPLYYKDEVYNSLLFKLFNSTGSLVYYEGHPTQWEYVPVNGQLQKGDILFFSELPKRSKGIMDGCEFVIAGQHSGRITDCAVYLGDDSILCLQEGRVQRMDGFAASSLFKSFDSARRIHTAVFDDKALIVEDLIAQIYDCLGTPYNSFNRTGDFSFDCSGIISWCFERMELYPKGYVYYHFTETTASGRATILDYIWHGKKQVHMVIPVALEEGQKSLDGFERGDIVFLLNSKGGKIGHVMVYLGDGRVIHSTYINKRYSGTVVANFRHAMQKLYYTSLRIETVS